MVRGQVVEIFGEGTEQHIDCLAKKDLGVDKCPHRAPGEKRVIAKIVSEKMFSIGDE